MTADQGMNSLAAELVIAGSAVEFRKQAKPVPAADRVPYRLGTLVLILSRCNRSTLSLAHLHVFAWSLRSPRTRAMMRAWWTGRRPMDSITERLAPGLEVTLRLALVGGLIALNPSTRRVSLSELGATVAGEIAADEELLKTEKDYLDAFGRISDTEADRRLGGMR